MIFTLPIIGALLNRLAGVGLKVWWSGKIIMPLWYFIFITCITLEPITALIVALGMLIYRSVGWGDYWDGSLKLNKEVTAIDYLVHDLFAVDSGGLNDFISMTLRGLLCAPMFIALSFVVWDKAALLSSIGLLQGFVYFGCGHFFGETRRSEIAEPIMGALLMSGVLVAIQAQSW